MKYEYIFFIEISFWQQKCIYFPSIFISILYLFGTWQSVTVWSENITTVFFSILLEKWEHHFAVLKLAWKDRSAHSSSGIGWLMSAGARPQKKKTQTAQRPSDRVRLTPSALMSSKNCFFITIYVPLGSPALSEREWELETHRFKIP